ncbi:MAG: exo-alpha-sialidase [Bacteroidales bacterium]|nr:exo-alpha-sialidase [Bacteroidales bacterium]
MMKLITILISLLAIVPKPQKGSAPIASIQELNRHSEEIDSHAGETTRSTLETDWRSTVILNEPELGYKYLDYPRIKTLPDGSYIMFYQSRDQQKNKDHMGVFSAFSKDGRTWQRGPDVWSTIPVTDPEGCENTRYYATCDAIILQNGEMLAFAQFRLGEKSLKYRQTWGCAMKRSTDLGKTWGEETVLFRDRVWEPYAIQLPSGEIQLYITHTNHDWEQPLTDITIMRSFDNGHSWTTNSPGLRFADGTSKAARKSVDMPAPWAEETTHFTSQMPTAILLHDGKTIMTCNESVKVVPKRHLMLSMGWNDASWPQGSLKGQEEGPEIIEKHFVGGSAPYFAQFNSGETVLSYTGNWWYMRTGNERGTDIPTAKFFSPVKVMARWGNIHVEDDHTLLATSASVHQENGLIKKLRDIVLATMRLNHRITAVSKTAVLDGSNDDWKDVDEAFFLGSESQAQCCFRFVQDKKNLYLLVDCLDNSMSAGDRLELYFSDGVDPIMNEGLLIETKSPDSISLKERKKTLMQAKVYPGEGYVAELCIPKSTIPHNGAAGICFNAVLKKGEMTDTFTLRTLDKVDNWFQVKFAK